MRGHGMLRRSPLCSSFAHFCRSRLGSAAPAQTTGMPSEIEWKLAELGAVINPPETAKLYAPLQEKEPYQGSR